MEPVTIIVGVINIAKVVKVGAVVAKAVTYKSCAVKGSRRAQKVCSAHFHAQLAHGKVHVLTDRVSGNIHKFGRNLFTGNTPVGKGLESVKVTPLHFFGNDGVTKSDGYQLLNNLETIGIRGNDVGWYELFVQAFDPVSLIL